MSAPALQPLTFNPTKTVTDIAKDCRTAMNNLQTYNVLRRNCQHFLDALFRVWGRSCGPQLTVADLAGSIAAESCAFLCCPVCPQPIPTGFLTTLLQLVFVITAVAGVCMFFSNDEMRKTFSAAAKTVSGCLCCIVILVLVITALAGKPACDECQITALNVTGDTCLLNVTYRSGNESFPTTATSSVCDGEPNCCRAINRTAMCEILPSTSHIVCIAPHCFWCYSSFVYGTSNVGISGFVLTAVVVVAIVVAALCGAAWSCFFTYESDQNRRRLFRLKNHAKVVVDKHEGEAQRLLKERATEEIV